MFLKIFIENAKEPLNLPVLLLSIPLFVEKEQVTVQVLKSNIFNVKINSKGTIYVQGVPK